MDTYSTFFIRKLSKEKQRVILASFIFSAIAANIFAYEHLYQSIHNIFLVKMTSIMFLMAIVWITDSYDRNFTKLMLLALGFHCIGDVIIESSSNILHAIAFFLVGHVLYACIFYRDIFNQTETSLVSIAKWRYGLILLVLLAAIWVLSLFLSNLSGALFYGVGVYILVLGSAAIFACLHKACMPYLGLGILMYIVSDFIIGYNEFIGFLSYRNTLAWPLYYFAQLFIVIGLLNYHNHHTKDENLTAS